MLRNFVSKDIGMLDLEITHPRDFALTGTDSFGTRLSSRILPAMLENRGGDWCETFFISKDCIALSIGDVCGHGKEKYKLMVAIRTIIHEAVLQGLSPMCALGEANRYLCTYYPDNTATAILAFLDTEKHSLIFANAGHPAPLIANREKTIYLEFPDADLMLGVDESAKSKIRIVDIVTPTLLVLYTDGVTEHRKDAIQGVQELVDAVTYAYDCLRFPKADIIERNMHLTGLNADDVSILTAFVY